LASASEDPEHGRVLGLHTQHVGARRAAVVQDAGRHLEVRPCIGDERCNQTTIECNSGRHDSHNESQGNGA
jgi:hypothetical protein